MNEYGVKWDLLRDAAILRRSDEALVRIVVPVTATDSDAARIAVTRWPAPSFRPSRKRFRCSAWPLAW